MNYRYKIGSDESRNWDKLKLVVKKRAGFKCECCAVRKGNAVHHIFYRGYAQEKPDDLLFVCTSCHNKLHLFYTFDDEHSPLDEFSYLCGDRAIKILGKHYNFMLEFSKAFRAHQRAFTNV
jgi:hypothetical protein